MIERDKFVICSVDYLKNLLNSNDWYCKEHLTGAVIAINDLCDQNNLDLRLMKLENGAEYWEILRKGDYIHV